MVLTAVYIEVGMYSHFFKRFLDIVLSLFAILILLLPFLIICLLIVIDDPGPVFFRQKRVGRKKNGKITYFSLCKFRTMKVSAPHDVPTHLLQNPDEYITRVGKFLRKTSLDELPQIYQIFTGKMSIIGPRPALWNQQDLVDEREKYGANDVRPGLTGWAQVNGYRGDTSIRKRIDCDLYYIENWTLGLDFKILFLTFFKGFVNKNAY